MQQSYDVVVIGGGVVGSAIARELSRYKLRIAVLEKESDVCTQTSGRNTGMLHAGFLYKTGSLKAICAVEGNQEFDAVAHELDVPFKRTGKLIVGFTDEHRQRLEHFMARGEANGVKGLELIDRKRMDELDPSAGGNFAMWCPASGILDPFAYTIALAENAVRNGLEDRMDFLCADVFDLLPALESEGKQFDVVILDPPAFTKSKNSVKNAVKGYREINLRGMKLVRDGGFLATCSCSHYMNAELFAQTIGQAARAAHCRLRQVEFRTQAPDHPILWSADESYYLKFYIFQICRSF